MSRATSFLAASVIACVAAAQTVPTTAKRLPRPIKPGPEVVRLEQAGQPAGIAALIDSQGLFLAHRSAVPGYVALGRSGSGEMMIFSVLSVDETTQLVLLQSATGAPVGAKPFKVVRESPTVGTVLNCWTTTGVVYGELVSADRPGQLKPSLRYAPMAEVRFETPPASVTGAIVEADGQLVGILGGTLVATDAPGVAKSEASRASAADSNYGPQGLTVGYSVSPVVLRRVVAGFLSPDHKVKHPNAGMFFKSAPGGGALVDAVIPGSAAESAGIRAGDIVLSFDGRAISNQIELASALFESSPGQSVVLRVRTLSNEREVTLLIGIQALSE